MARLLIVSRSMALSTRLADQHQVSEHPVADVDGLLPALTAAEAGPGPFDVLVLDLGDPVQAVETVNALREAGSGVPVLLVSGYQPEWEEVEQQDVEGVRVVPLPITRSSLLEGVTALLRGDDQSDDPDALVQIGAGAAPDLERAGSAADIEDMRRRNPRRPAQPHGSAAPIPPAADVDEAALEVPDAIDEADVVAEAEAAVEAAAQETADEPETGLEAEPSDDVTAEPSDVVADEPTDEVSAEDAPDDEADETEIGEAESETAPEVADELDAEPGVEAAEGTEGEADDVLPAGAPDALPDETAETARVVDEDATPPRGLPLSGSGPTAPPWEQVVAPTPRPRWTRGPESPPTGGIAAGPNRPLQQPQSQGGRARMFQRRPQHGPTLPGTGLVTDPLGPRTDPYGFSTGLERRLDEEAGALAGDAAYRDANGVAMRTPDLIRALIESAQHLYGVADTAQVLADDVIEKADADAAAVLIPDGPAWRVSGGVGLRPLERRLVLEETHWLIAEIGLSGRAVLIDDTDFVRQQLSGAPLAAWRHLLAVPIPEVHGIVVLARGQEGGPFSDRDLSVVISPVREAAPLIAQAIETRRLARLLNPLREQDSPS
ncbi:hypothetical protein ACIB24_20625 [Spongisporangium articulatum]|uniref:Response regulatory domain-containing protein n=1 Tax=Spongisporangium articulatum TaxID=3362603 RepID=A0ABW8AUD2_9ACTN